MQTSSFDRQLASLLRLSDNTAAQTGKQQLLRPIQGHDVGTRHERVGVVAMKIIAVDQPDLPPLEMPPRFRTEIVYFMTPSGMKGAPADLGPSEYWIDLDEAKKWLEELVVYVVSPLDAQNQAEIELTDDHERWLQWLVDNGVQRVRVE